MYYTLAVPNIYLFSYIANWIGPMDNFWSRNTCPKIGDSLHPVVLDRCKTSCVATEGCTAINYNTDSNACEHLRCNRPVPDPTGSLGNWMGYYFTSGINIQH